MGCASSDLSQDTPQESNNPLVRKITLVLPSDSTVAPLAKKVTIKYGTKVEDGDISLIKRGEHFVILGTSIVMDVATCAVIGFVNDSNELVRELSTALEEACKTYNLVFRK